MKANYQDKMNRKKIKPFINYYLHKKECDPQEEIFEYTEEPDTTVKTGYGNVDSSITYNI